MTKLYWDYPYTFQIDTQVTEARLIDGQLAIVCADQLLHPAGGGQPRDAGAITFGAKRMEVIDLKRRDGKVWLVLSGVADPLEMTGRMISCTIDPDRRLRMMRAHTASHVAMAGLRAALGNTFASRGMEIDESATSVRLYFEATQLISTEALDTVTEFMRSAIERDLPVDTRTFKSVDAARAAGGPLFRMDPDLDFRGRIRVICIPGTDFNPCGGTHVKRLGEIGSPRIVGTQQPTDQDPGILDVAL